jgi:hypothetical protein
MRFKLVPADTPYDWDQRKPLPGCGHDVGVYTNEAPYFEGGFMWMPKRLVGWCNAYECDQRFYLYPATGRITRRNTGETLKERRARLGHI